MRHAGAWEPPQVCGYEKDSMDSIAGYDGRVIECLQDYKAELSNEQCKASVHTLTERAAQDIRMDRPLADACYEDRKRLCEAVSPGSARVLRCLQDSREQLSYECRATLFDQEVRTRGWSQHPTAAPPRFRKQYVSNAWAVRPCYLIVALMVVLGLHGNRCGWRRTLTSSSP